MSVALDENLTRALGSALRALDERIALAERMRRQASDVGRVHLAESWTERAREFEQEANVLRQSITRVDEISRRYAQESTPNSNETHTRAHKEPARASSGRQA